MTDTTAKPIRVSTDGTGKFSWIKLPADQLDRVRTVLDANRVGYWVEHGVISFDGGPYMAWIQLRRKTDPNYVQSLLDAAA